MSPRADADATESILLPRAIRLAPNLFAAAFALMKVVPARHILLAAERRGELGADTTIVETSSGTFGLALAMQAALLRRRLVLCGDPAIDADLRRRLHQLGAEVVICREPARVGGYQQARMDRLEQIVREIDDTFWPNQYGNPENPRSYSIVAEHLASSLGSIDCVVGPVGSGGSMCGTVAALRAAGSPQVVAVGVDTHGSVLFGQPDGPRRLRGLGMSVVPGNLDHRVFDQVHWCTDVDAYAATRELHRRHALFRGPTSGAAYRVALWWAQRHADARCVVLMPDEGYRYQRSVYDDRWLRRNGLDLARRSAEPVEVAGRAVEGCWSWQRWNRRPLAVHVGDCEPAGAGRGREIEWAR